MSFPALGHRDRLLVHAATATGPTAATAWREWFDEIDLDDIPYPEGRLLPQVFVNLNAQGLRTECVPLRMRGKYRWLWARNQLRAVAVAPVLRMFDAAGIETMILKGSALLAAERRGWGTREMGDVDILVSTARAGDAAQMLADRGWRADLGVTPRFLARRLVVRRHGWNFTADDPVASIDLHWHVFEEGRGKHADDRLWRAAIPTKFGDSDTLRLNDSDHLVKTIEHASHDEGAQRVDWLVDVESLLPHVDERRLVRTATAMNLRDVVGEGLEIAASVLESGLADRLAVAVRRARPSVRARLLASTNGPGASTAPRRNELLRTALMHTWGTALPFTAIGAVHRRRVEPSVVTRPALSTGLALLGRKRRAEVAALRWLGPITRSTDESVPTGVWMEITPELLDRIGGPGWSWPSPDGGGVWTDGAEARLALDIGDVHDRDLVLSFDLGVDAHHSPNPAVELLVNGRALEGWQLGPDPEPGPRHVRVPAWLTDWCRPLQVVLRPFAPFDPWARRGARDDQHRFVPLRALRVDVQ